MMHIDIKTGLGVDSTAICSRDMFCMMHLLLETQRTRDNAELARRGKIPLKLSGMVDHDGCPWGSSSGSQGKRHWEFGSWKVGRFHYYQFGESVDDSVS